MATEITLPTLKLPDSVTLSADAHDDLQAWTENYERLLAEFRAQNKKFNTVFEAAKAIETELETLRAAEPRDYGAIGAKKDALELARMDLKFEQERSSPKADQLRSQLRHVPNLVCRATEEFYWAVEKALKNFFIHLTANPHRVLELVRESDVLQELGRRRNWSYELDSNCLAAAQEALRVCRALLDGKVPWPLFFNLPDAGPVAQG